MEKSILVGLETPEQPDMEYSMEELAQLAEACEYEVVMSVFQSLPHPVAATYIGSGKVSEVSALTEELEADCVIFEDTLSPAQLKNLQKQIPVRIMDRTGLILEIFSKRAKTREARLQVETANLQYMLPRLIGMWEAIGRQGGTSGSGSNRGIGETQLELDRRWIQKRLTELKRELDEVEHDRNVQRSHREKTNIPLVALVGYTNAGKSTVMNRLIGMSEENTDKQVFEKDMLFATLDTSVRHISCPDRKDFLLSDTVGFINKLPHSLIKAFRSTLDEIKYADLLVEVVDYSDEHYTDQMRVTAETLRELGADDIPVIHVLNKIDKCEPGHDQLRIRDDCIYMSAANMLGIKELLDMIKEQIYAGNKTAVFFIPYSRGDIVSDLNANAQVCSQEYLPEGVKVTADVTESQYGRLKEYVITDQLPS